MNPYIESATKFENPWQLRLFRLTRMVERTSIVGILKIKAFPNSVLTVLEKAHIKLRNQPLSIYLKLDVQVFRRLPDNRD
jgi:hypothetical protein